MLHSDSLIVMSTPTSAPASDSARETAHQHEAPHTHETVPLFVDCWQGKAGAGRVLLIIHGLWEHSGRYRHLPEHLGETFERFYAMDQRGHGRSGGLRGFSPSFDHLVQDIKRVAEEIQDRERGKKLYVLGHSFGGLAVLRMLLNEPEVPFEGAIVSAPLLGVKARMPHVKQVLSEMLAKALPKIQLSAELNPADLSHDPLVVEAYVKDRLVHNKMTPQLHAEIEQTMRSVRAQTGPLACPTLFLLPGDDRIVDGAVTMEFYKNLQGANKEVRNYPGLYHESMNETGKEAVFEDIKKWLAQPIFRPAKKKN